MDALITYFRTSVEELKLVRWPTQQQAIRLTVITVVFIALASTFFGLVDAMFTEIVRFTTR
jgi:preprotein translocase SecE subunit